MIKKIDKNKLRVKRHLRIRQKISGTKAVPRLNVYRSNRHIYAQLIDDATGTTLASASSKTTVASGSTSNREAAAEVGKAIAQKAIEAGYENVVFDRGGYLYHGRVQQLAEAAREAGLKF